MPFDLILRGGTVALPWGLAEADIGIRASRIAAIGKDLGAAEAFFEAQGLHILPGIIDPHVHFRDGGLGGIPGVEDLRTGSLGAVLGGITTVFDMPNTTPPATSAETIERKVTYISGQSYCEIGVYAGGTKENIEDLAALEQMHGVCGIKIFAGSSTGNLLVEDDASIERVMRSGRRRISFHSEDEYRLQARKSRFSCGDPYASHAEWRDVECAYLGTRRITALARKTGRPAHILHVSTVEEFEYLKDHKDLMTAEVLLNHLVQEAPDVYDRLGPYAVMNPPIRDARHRAAAWEAVADGTVDTLASDHAPHSAAAKEKPWPDCASGLTGVQTLLPMMLTQAAEGRLPLVRLVDLMSAGPARVYGAVNKGRIAAGYDADFSIVDLAARRRIEKNWIVSPCGWTPFEGASCTGWPIATIIRGNVVMFEGVVEGEPLGRPVAFR